MLQGWLLAQYSLMDMLAHTLAGGNQQAGCYFKLGKDPTFPANGTQTVGLLDAVPSMQNPSIIYLMKHTASVDFLSILFLTFLPSTILNAQRKWLARRTT